MFSRDIPKKFLREIGKQEFKDERIRNRECFTQGLQCVLAIDTSSDEAYVSLFLMILKLFAIFGVFILVLLPYLIQLSPLYVLLFTLKEEI